MVVKGNGVPQQPKSTTTRKPLVERQNAAEVLAGRRKNAPSTSAAAAESQSQPADTTDADPAATTPPPRHPASKSPSTSNSVPPAVSSSKSSKSKTKSKAISGNTSVFDVDPMDDYPDDVVLPTYRPSAKAHNVRPQPSTPITTPTQPQAEEGGSIHSESEHEEEHPVRSGRGRGVAGLEEIDDDEDEDEEKSEEGGADGGADEEVSDNDAITLAKKAREVGRVSVDWDDENLSTASRSEADVRGNSDTEEEIEQPSGKRKKSKVVKRSSKHRTSNPANTSSYTYDIKAVLETAMGIGRCIVVCEEPWMTGPKIDEMTLEAYELAQAMYPNVEVTTDVAYHLVVSLLVIAWYCCLHRSRLSASSVKFGGAFATTPVHRLLSSSFLKTIRKR